MVLKLTSQEYVYSDLTDAQDATARVPMPSMGASKPGSKTDGRTATPTTAVGVHFSPDDEYVVRVPEETAELVEDSIELRDTADAAVPPVPDYIDT